MANRRKSTVWITGRFAIILATAPRDKEPNRTWATPGTHAFGGPETRRERTSMSDTTGGPVFTGLVVHRDLRYRYSFLLPEGWHDLELDTQEGRGRIFTPDADDVSTSLSVEARDLGTTITGTLREGLEEGLHQLHDLTIEKQEDYAIGALVGFEYWFTFREAADGPLRKRWLRLAYQGQIQVRMIAQGATPEAFEYWLPLFNQAIRTFQFADWWAEMTGHSWQQSLVGDVPDDEVAGDDAPR